MTESRAFFLAHLCNAMEERCALSTLFPYWLVQSVKNELYMFLFDDSRLFLWGISLCTAIYFFRGGKIVQVTNGTSANVTKKGKHVHFNRDCKSWLDKCCKRPYNTGEYIRVFLNESRYNGKGWGKWPSGQPRTRIFTQGSLSSSLHLRQWHAKVNIVWFGASGKERVINFKLKILVLWPTLQCIVAGSSYRNPFEVLKSSWIPILRLSSFHN